MSPEEVEKILTEYNIVLAQLPKISSSDPGLPEGCKTGDVIKVQRKEETYYRVVI